MAKVTGNGLLGKGCLGQTFRTLDKSAAEILKQCLNVSNLVSGTIYLTSFLGPKSWVSGELYGSLEGFSYRWVYA